MATLPGNESLSETEKLVYQITDGYVKIASVGKMPVSAFSLMLTHNGIPALRINTVPKEYKTDKPSQDGEADVASLDEFVNWYNKLAEASEDTSKRVSDFYFQAVSSGGDTQELDLKGWLLTAVGYGGLSASGAMQLSLELVHPAKKINECAVNFFGLIDNSDAFLPFNISGTDVYAGMVKTLELYSKSSTAFSSAISDPEYKIMQQKFENAREAFGQHIKWNDAKHGWPDDSLSEISEYIPYALWDYVWSIHSATLWDGFVHHIVDDWHVSIRPTYWETALTMEPYAPWAAAELSISSNDISDLTLPPADPQNVSGAITLASAPELGSFTAFVNPQAAALGESDAAIWLEADTIGGAIVSFTPPPWYFRALTYSGQAANGGALGSNTDNNSNMPMSATGSVADLTNISPDVLLYIQNHLKAFARENFVESFRRMFEVSVMTRLMITYGDDEDHVHPGIVHDIKTESGRTLLTYFATRVIHTVDCVNKQAYTQITGSYLRREGGPTNITAIPGGSVDNILYGGTPQADGATGGTNVTSGTGGMAPSVGPSSEESPPTTITPKGIDTEHGGSEKTLAGASAPLSSEAEQRYKDFLAANSSAGPFTTRTASKGA